MTKDKLLSEKELGYKVSAENWRESYFKLMDKQAEAVKKLKSALLTKGRRINRRIVKEEIDKIMGNFNHSPQDTKLNSGDSSFKSQPEDNNIKGCGKTFKQKSNLSEYTARCGQLICPEVELCPKCQVNNIKGLKVIDGTPTAISNYLSEREKDNNIKGCGGKIC